MEWTSLNDLREKYLSFFESKGHMRLKSFSLVPNNDKSLLLINSGMAPMKKYFTGEVTPPSKRVTTCQKCIRTPDLERVGHTARHGTYFEMLGNFSFGDYFKNEAIEWSWEFLTEVVGLDPDRLYPSVYEEDDEAFDIWNKKMGIPAERIFRFGKEDNFWEHGSGPCGPCSEIYYDRGEKYGCGKPGCTVGCECDRYMEIWNNVFSQFNNDGHGNYTDLIQKNIDTGMGLERLACIVQDVDSMFDIDTMKALRDHVCRLSGKQYGTDHETDVSLRVVTDHVRSVTFMISDGILPSNSGRGYVLRRLLRRACRHGKLLGIEGAFLVELATTVIEGSKDGYPELEEKKAQFGVQISTDNRDVAAFADILFVAVKPQFYAEVLEKIKDLLTEEQILVSIAPGKTLVWFDEVLGRNLKVIRTMPNTPSMVKEGMMGMCAGARVTDADMALVRDLCSGFSQTEVIPEHLMDVVTAVSGSSPAYVFMFIEAMADAAVAGGMPRQQAYKFAAQAVLGSAKMVLETGKHPGELKDMVCSPAGTTIQAVRVLEEKGMRSSVIEAMMKCLDISRNM